MSEEPPKFDESGINLADPFDRRGLKTEYITLLQELAIARHVDANSQAALDIGCGYGRMTRRIRDLGFSIVGMDPSHRVLKYALEQTPSLPWIAGSLPNTPFREHSFSCVFLLNVIRSLHLMGEKTACSSVGSLIKPGGHLVIIENIKLGDSRYVSEEWLVAHFQHQGLTLRKRIAIRSSRWYMIYLIRYGLIPRQLLPIIARWELRRMQRKAHRPKVCYFNVLFIFERQG